MREEERKMEREDAEKERREEGARKTRGGWSREIGRNTEKE